MATKTESTAKGAAAGAATGAAFGPYGAAVGGVAGGVYGYFSGGESDAEKAQRAAEEAKLEQGRRAAIALSNYRQSSRDQYHQLLVNRMAPYQPYSNRLAAGWGQGMSTAGLSAAENPVTLRDTGVGAAQGSNYTGWDERNEKMVNGNRVIMTTHHKGIGDYLDGTAPTDNVHPGSPGIGFDYNEQRAQAGASRDDPNWGVHLTRNVDGSPGNQAVARDNAARLNLERQQSFVPAGPWAGTAPAATYNGPAGGYSFFPRKA